jgi:hypothetical protein
MKTYKSNKGLYFNSALACALDNLETINDFRELYTLMYNRFTPDLTEWRHARNFSESNGFAACSVDLIISRLINIDVLK